MKWITEVVERELMKPSTSPFLPVGVAALIISIICLIVWMAK